MYEKIYKALLFILTYCFFISDGDGHQDSKDNCPSVINSSQLDTDKDGMVELEKSHIRSHIAGFCVRIDPRAIFFSVRGMSVTMMTTMTAYWMSMTTAD